MARIRTRWNDRQRTRSPEEVASALGVVIWKLAGEAVVTLENEDYAIDSYAQRLDVIAEFCAFQLHVVDRTLHAQRSEEERGLFVSALAKHLADTMQDNRTDAQGEGDYRAPFIALLNERSAFYASCSFSAEEGPSFVMRRNFGNQVAAVVGERNRRWVADYVMDVQAPSALATLRRALPSLFA